MDPIHSVDLEYFLRNHAIFPEEAQRVFRGITELRGVLSEFRSLTEDIIPTGIIPVGSPTMDERALIDALNSHLLTEDAMPITAQSSFFQNALKESIFLHNQSYADLLVQAYVGRYFLRSGERVVISLAKKRISRRDLYPEILHTLLEMMLVVITATLAYVLVKRDS